MSHRHVPNARDRWELKRNCSNDILYCIKKYSSETFHWLVFPLSAIESCLCIITPSNHVTCELIIHNYPNTKEWIIMSHGDMYFSAYILKFYLAPSGLFIALGILNRGHGHTGQFDWDFCFITVMSGNNAEHWEYREISLIARFMGATCGPSGVDRSQVGPMLAPLTLLSGYINAASFVVLCSALCFVASWRHMATWTWINVGSGYGSRHSGTKPLPEAMLTFNHKVCVSH